MVVNEEHRWEAPGSLELVRVLLNTGLPPRDGDGEDRLLGLRADPARWAAAFPGVPVPSRRQAAELVELRDGLLRLVAAPPTQGDAAWLGGWFERAGLGVRVGVTDGALGLGHAAPARSGLAGAVVEAVAAALAGGTWSRLRRCPDCKLVFWDRTRNASKVWCGMYAGADGRACGSIAKVRRYRARRAGTTS
jgi:predicted RNA-binding Zn ribbon-like protein